MGKSIGVVSLKGGVGKTTAVVALGSALADFGKKVLLVDGNFSAPNLGFHLDLFDTEKTIHNVLKREVNPSEAVYHFDNFDVLPASVFWSSNFNPLLLRERLRHLKRSYDIILIDSSPSLNEETLAVMNASDDILVVTTPDHATLGTTIKAVKMAKQRSTPIVGLIINKVYKKNFEIPVEEIEDLMDLPVMAVVPHDVGFLESLSKCTPYTKYSSSEGSEEFRKLAATMIGEKYKPVIVRRFFRWINPRKQDINREIFYNSIFDNQ
jgi:septum site-determining protein MinD